MKLLIALTMVAMFLATPLICVAMPCDFTTQTNDCCPKSRGVVACPYDVLETAKATPAILDASVPVLSALPQPLVSAERVAATPTLISNNRDLHTRIRVLLI